MIDAVPRRSAPVFLLLAFFSGVLLASPARSDGPGSPPGYGDLVGVPSPLRMVPTQLSAVADGNLLIYRMPGIRGSEINATAMLFTPKGPPPAGGWPVLVWGHGTVGWAPKCAPSVRLQENGTWVDGHTDTLLAAVLRMGVAVIAPDYEGLGPVSAGVRPGHGYYDLSSEGSSMVFAVVAAQRDPGTRLSGQWVAAGWSEGGFAALAAAYYSGVAEKADPALDYRGTVTFAPVPDIPAMNKVLWRDIADASRPGSTPTEHEIDQLVFANAETIYFTETERHAGYGVDPVQVYGPNMLKFYQQNSQTCLDDLNAMVRKDIVDYLRASPSHRLGTYPGVRGDAPNSLPENSRFFTDNQGRLESSTLPGPILWLFGTDDITSPASVTYDVVNKMLTNGNDINLAVLAGAGHYDVPTAALPLVEARLKTLFSLG
ncbi:lipase family protein [Pseudofrankia sp. DC12]|uniref:alpha/beta hydrolase family protein n=1 Tax=Pseudofrankia sp. DC12 TaxID=683315 RepID=UPI000B2C67B5|nr:lipase family protein [Pseudofrankia sp. DC12]